MGGVTEARDLNQLVPGLQIGQGGTATQIFIRGVGDESVSLYNNPGVAFNVDGVYVARPEAVGLNFYDVQRVEVLKGPQGTLYGRNASGGAINLITNKPDFSGLSGYGTFEGGNYGLKHVTGAINVPLSDTVAVRGAFDVVDRGGYLTDGTDDDKQEAGRIHVLWQPNDRVSLLTTIDYAHRHGKGPGYVATPAPAGSSPYLGSTDPVAVNYLATQAPLGAAIAFGAPPLDRYGVQGGETLLPPFVDNTGWDIATKLNYDMGWATLTVLPSYRDFVDNERSYPGFRSEQDFHSREFTSEVRLGKDTKRLKWVAGLYYFLEEENGYALIDQGVPQLTNATYPSNVARSYAAYGQVTYSVLKDLRLIAGLRYTIDDRRFRGASRTSSFLAPANPTPFVGSRKFHSLTWKGGFEYDVTPENMLYFTASTGYKAGGINQEVAPNGYMPEKLTAYELGMRNRFLDNRLQVNLELFKWDYANHQEGVITFDNSGSPNFLTVNAGNASIQGASVDVVAKVTPDDTFRGYIEYDDLHYDSFLLDEAAFTVHPGLSTGCPVGPSAKGAAFLAVNCAGFQLARAPAWTGSASWEHDFHIANGADLSARASANLISARWGAVDFTKSERLPQTVVGNFDLTYMPGSGHWSVTGYVHNISDERVASAAILQKFQPTQGYFNVDPPRTYGARITYYLQ